MYSPSRTWLNEYAALNRATRRKVNGFHLDAGTRRPEPRLMAAPSYQGFLQVLCTPDREAEHRPSHEAGPQSCDSNYSPLNYDLIG